MKIFFRLPKNASLSTDILKNQLLKILIYLKKMKIFFRLPKNESSLSTDILKKKHFSYF